MAGLPRTINLIRPPDVNGVGVFRIVADGVTSHYVFREIRCDIGGRGFAVHKLGLGDLYYVRIGRPSSCSCECLGFLRNHHCRHIDGLLALERDGKLIRPRE